MADLDLNLNLRKFKSEVITTKKGTRCIVIPLIENNLIEGKEGGIHVNFKGWELDVAKQEVKNNFKNTHIVKQKLSKDTFDKLTDAQKKELPIFGNVTEYVGTVNNEPVQSETVTPEDFPADDTDSLPF